MMNLDLDLEVKSWDGRVVFSESVPDNSPSPSPASPQPSSSSSNAKSETQVSGSQDSLHSQIKPGAPSTPARSTAQGSFTSPISISSDSSPEHLGTLPRPRASIHYSTQVSRTAYTPPSKSLSGSSTQQPGKQVEVPLHPFFKRDFTRSQSTPPLPPPASQRPRLVACYSSTSASSQASTSTFTTQGSHSTLSQERQRGESTSARRAWNIRDGRNDTSSWNVGYQRDIELVTHTLESMSVRAVSPTERSSSGSEPDEPIEWKATTGTPAQIKSAAPTKVPMQKGRSGSGTGTKVDELEAMLRDITINEARFNRKPAFKKVEKKASGKVFDKTLGTSSSTWTTARKTTSAAKVDNTQSGIDGRPASLEVKQAFAPTARPSQSSDPSALRVEGTTTAKRTTSPLTTDIKPIIKPTTSSASPTASTSFNPETDAATPPILSMADPSTYPPFDIAPDLPTFTYKTLLPKPKVVYTEDLDEADLLLSSLKGNIMGFDMEWPTHRHKGPNGKPLGMTWGGDGKPSFSVPKTALLQFSDGKLVVLIQIWNMKKLPPKAVEILQNESIYKLGVQVAGDGKKIVRDRPTNFTSNIKSLLELSYLARTADPLRTGPGKVLISLAKLTAAYLGSRLPKGQERISNWSLKLTEEQIEYAANDVVCAVELYKVLVDKARDNGIELDLNTLCSQIDVPKKK